MRLHYWGFVAMMLMASSHAAAQDAAAQNANEAIMVCQYKAAIDLDDGVSDVKSLSPVIADWCQKESNQFYQIMRSRVGGPIDERAARRAIREKDLEMAGRILLMKRADERKARQNR